MNRTAYRVLLGKIWENLKIQSSDDEIRLWKVRNECFEKNAEWDAKIGVDTSENLTKKFRRSFETPQSAVLTAQTEKGTEPPIQFKHPASSAGAAV